MSSNDSAAAGPLAGVRVVEITKYVQGPVAGLMLASLGAEVVKIELVGRQDTMRTTVADTASRSTNGVRHGSTPR